MILVASVTAWALSSSQGAGRAKTAEAPTRIVNLHQFLSQARKGESESFAASYRYLAGFYRGRVFTYLQRPRGGVGSMDPFEAGDFVYTERYRNTTFQFIQRNSNDYECLRASGAEWSCAGPSWGSIGNAMAALRYDLVASIESFIAPNSNTPVAVSAGHVNGLAVTCIHYQRGPSGTPWTRWCITRHGVTVYVSSWNYSTMELLSLLPSPPANAFKLPATPVRWHGYVKGMSGLFG